MLTARPSVQQTCRNKILSLLVAKKPQLVLLQDFTVLGQETEIFYILTSMVKNNYTSKRQFTMYNTRCTQCTQFTQCSLSIVYFACLVSCSLLLPFGHVVAILARFVDLQCYIKSSFLAKLNMFVQQRQNAKFP